jgi:hypothetical protein
MKAVKAAKTTGPAAPLQQRAQLPQVDCADPTLQGTYVAQDDDVTAGNEIDNFEARLANGGVAPARSVAQRAPPQQRAPQASVPQQHMRAPAAAMVKRTPGASTAPLTEEEEERRQDIDDVRQLRTAEESSSDDE